MPIRKIPGSPANVPARASGAPGGERVRGSEAPHAAADPTRLDGARPDAFRPTADFTRVIGDSPVGARPDLADYGPEPEPLFFEVGQVPPPGVPRLEKAPPLPDLDADAIAANKAAALTGPTTLAALRAAGVEGRRHTPEEKEALRQLVLANLGEGEHHPFPDPGLSGYGLNTYLMEGPAAAQAARFVQAQHGIEVPLDLEKQSVLVTMRWFDEWPAVGLFLYDRERQELVFGFENQTPRYDAAVVDKFFPTRFQGEKPIRHAIGSLAQHGELLAFIKHADVVAEYENYTFWGA